ncbi:hypothetical protein GE061_015719 [Apolygus lucorum]|uniref:Tyr recombinase domain-containing protein n=1 Tax=Apolygus lucorum TaxID=248454 RepID=A0A8S9XMY3_APOLU|nr:hypothetical protein GE061_015719 [Apolygus lucorum]
MTVNSGHRVISHCFPSGPVKGWCRPFCIFFGTFTIVMLLLVMSIDLKRRQYLPLDAVIWDFEGSSQYSQELVEIIRRDYIHLPNNETVDSDSSVRNGVAIECGATSHSQGADWFVTNLDWRNLKIQANPIEIELLRIGAHGAFTSHTCLSLDTAASHMTTLGALFEQTTEDPFLNEVKKIITNTYPEGWKDWRLKPKPPLTKEVDRNRLRFALPTLLLVQAYTPGATHISERRYKQMKAALFSWPLGQALLTSPPSFASDFRPSQQDYDNFLENMKPLKHLFISRDRVNSILTSEKQMKERAIEDTTLPATTNEPQPAARYVSPQQPSATDDEGPEYESISPPRPTMVQLIRQHLRPVEERVEAMKDEILAALSSQQPESYIESAMSQDESESDRVTSPELNDPRVNSQISTHKTGTPAGLDTASADPWGDGQLEATLAGPSSTSWLPDFAPTTIEREPEVPEPDAVLQAQVVDCLRLGHSSWDRIRYTDAEKKLKHGGSFRPLQSNHQLTAASHDKEFSLRQQERIMGNMLYGLLAQRNAFQKAIARRAVSNPELASILREDFTNASTEFRQESDGLLQYVCGKRAELIAERRRNFIPQNYNVQRQLNEIPPSASHLFDEGELAKCALPLPSRRNAPPNFRKRPATTSAPANQKRMRTNPTSYQPRKRLQYPNSQQSAWRPSTISSYRHPWARWRTWAEQEGLDPLQPSPVALARFLAFLHTTVRLAPASIAVHKSVVASWSSPHHTSGLASHPIVRKMMKGITCSQPKKEVRSIWDISKLKNWIQQNPPQETSFFQVSRHVAILLLLASGRRVHDLTLLSVDASHFQEVPPDLVFWPEFGAKTDNASYRQSGWRLSPDPNKPLWDIVKWTKLLLHMRHSRCGSKHITRLFISSRGRVKAATRAVIAKWVATALTAAGIEAAPGSFRSAVNSHLARLQVPLDDILSRANWKSSGTFLKHYYRPISGSSNCDIGISSFMPTA